MKAGSELDAIWFGIVEKVMNWQISDIEFRYVRTDVSNTPRRFDPLNNMSDAWLVVEKMREVFFFKLEDESNDKFTCTLDHEVTTIQSEAETAPLAICLADLKACGVEV